MGLIPVVASSRLVKAIRLSGYPDVWIRRGVGSTVESTSHKGSLVATVPDGRNSLDLRDGLVLVLGITGSYQRHPDRRDHEIVPDDDVTGWRALCSCGWEGPLWRRVSDRETANLLRRRAYVPFLGVASPSVGVEAAIRSEWFAHARPADAVGELEAAAESLKQAQERLNRKVLQARAAGVSWASIGASVGMTRQAAHERWGRQ